MEALGISNETGTMEVGKIADLVAVAGDPLNDIGSLARPILVVKDGRAICPPDQADAWARFASSPYPITAKPPQMATRPSKARAVQYLTESNGFRWD